MTTKGTELASTDKDSGVQSTESSQPPTRRSLLRLAGLGAAGAVVGVSGVNQAAGDPPNQQKPTRHNMDTEVIAHPGLQHYGLITANLNAMVDWYRKVLGMTVTHRSELPQIARGQAPFAGFAFVTMDALHHRLVFFHVPDSGADPNKRKHIRLQHVAYNYKSLDELLGTYVRLKKLGILPEWAADHGVSLSIYYLDPDRNRIELNFDNYDDEWMGTEFMRSSGSRAVRPAEFDPDKMVVARDAGESPWLLHQRALAGEFAPAKPYDPRADF
jgi:catechol 2,3-dioxygenase-like lactoylglutathione lyase family enzyme